MAAYATVDDVKLVREISETEQAKVESWLEYASDLLRVEAQNVGKDIDAMIAKNASLSNIAKNVVVSSVVRALNTSATVAPMEQVSQSALGYSVSGTYLNPGSVVPYFLKSERRSLGLRRQRFGAVDHYQEAEDD